MVQTEFRPARELYPFESRWFDGPHGRMHYLDEGRGQPILLLHGNPTWSFLYRKMVPALSSLGFRCVVPDLLGYGLSEHPPGFGFTVAEQVDAVSALTHTLALEELVVMGQDWAVRSRSALPCAHRVPSGESSSAAPSPGARLASPASSVARFGSASSSAGWCTVNVSSQE